jgi:hypothetical protein
LADLAAGALTAFSASPGLATFFAGTDLATFFAGTDLAAFFTGADLVTFLTAVLAFGFGVTFLTALAAGFADFFTGGLAGFLTATFAFATAFFAAIFKSSLWDWYLVQTNGAQM